MSYELLKLPFEFESFDKLNKKQTQEFFDWYVGEIDNRISLLIHAMSEDGVNDVLDYSIESLIPLWRWFETKISFRKRSKIEVLREIIIFPEWMKEYISKEDLSFETMAYVSDIAMYFAEVMIRNTDGKVQWGYFTKPKNRMSVNEPVLLGFKDGVELNSRRIVNNCARCSSREKQPERLFNIYNVWMEYL